MNEEETVSVEALDELIEVCNKNIELGNHLKRLSKNPDFKKLISGVFISDGKKYLWENIITLEEQELKDKGTTRTENIGRMKIEIQARLIFDRFLDSVKNDADMAVDQLEQITAAKSELQAGA